MMNILSRSGKKLHPEFTVDSKIRYKPTGKSDVPVNNNELDEIHGRNKDYDDTNFFYQCHCIEKDSCTCSG